MRKILAGGMIGLLLVVFGAAVVVRAQAVCDTPENCAKEIENFTRDLNLSIQATTPLESEVAKLAARLRGIQAGIARLNEEQKKKAEEIEREEINLADQFKIFQNRVDQQYRYNRTFSPLVVLLTSARNAEGLLALKYSLTLAERDKQSIDTIGQNILDLQAAKQAAADQARKLAALQGDLDKQKAFFEKEIAGAKQYQAELGQKIAALSARQQQLLAEKTGTAQTSVGEVPLADDFNASPDFNPGFSPAFAAFSFGAPHFKGMSQYGAFGRAKSGQNYETILKAYYGDIELRKVDMPGSITVSNVGSMPFEGQYLKGIAEMPASWADKGGYEALKAQAIAARTYALSYTKWTISDPSIKQAICATEACQVYKSQKFLAGGRWHDAVRDTEGIVAVSRSTGNIFATWYASTAGGHTLSYTSLGHNTPSVWDTTSDWARWADGAFESVKYLGKDDASPWFYKGWYKSRSGDTCGRSHPWLTREEMADILNAWVVRRHASGGDLERVSPLGACWGGNPYSLNEMREKAKSYGEEYTSISSVRVEHGNNGYTSKVVLSTNRGEVSIGGAEFKEIFNLRAPGRIAIKGKLFDLRQR